MDQAVDIAVFIVAFAGFLYLLAFGQVPLKEALPYGVQSLLGTRRRWTTIASFKKRVTAVAFSPDGKRIAAGGFDSTIHLIEFPSRKADHFPVHEQVIRALHFGKDAARVYSCADDGRILALNTTKRMVSLVGEHRSPVYAILISVDDTVLYAADRLGHICMWDVQSAGWQEATATTHFSRPHPLLDRAILDGPIFALTFMATEEVFLCAGAGGQLLQVDARSFSATTVHNFDATVFSMTFDAHHKVVYAACADGRLRYFNFADNSAGSLEGHTDSARWVVSRPPNTIISSSKDRTIRVWKRGQAAHTILEGHKDYVYQISLSPDGTRLASACGDGSVYVWDLPL